MIVLTLLGMFFKQKLRAVGREGGDCGNSKVRGDDVHDRSNASQ